MSVSTARVLADYRSSDFAISSTDLIFELDDENTLVTNTMVIKRLSDASATLSLDGEHIKLISITLDGKRLTEDDYEVTNTKLLVPIDNLDVTLTIVTQINPLKNTALEGLFKSGNAFCTQCEAEGFRRITYYLDRPDVMARFTTKIIANKAMYPQLLSNGNKIDEGDLDNGLHFVTWSDPFLKPCYLFALVAGDFDQLQDTYVTSSGKNVALEIFVDKGNLYKSHHAMESLKRAMAWDERVFGLEYDLDIYMIVAVDFFNMGAMENKGLNVFNSKFVLADQKSATDTDYFNVEAVIAHEYFHNWTGNRVTCRDWFQLSLKEGLTVFRDQQFSADMHSASVTRIQNVRVLRAQQFAEDAGPMSHPIRPEKVIEMNNFYTLTVYEKGAEVIRMIHTLLGVDKFRLGMDLYFKRFDGMAVTCDDFVNAMADASGIDLTQFKYWYSQSGTPLLNVVEHYDNATEEFSITVSQIHTPTKTQPTKHNLLIPIKIELLNGEQSEQHLLSLSQDTQTWCFPNHDKKPVVAFLSDFSAPVKVNFEQTDQELAHVIVHASDAFNRWDATQKLLTNIIKCLMDDDHFVIPEQLVTIFSDIVCSEGDSALKAELLTLPSFDELAELFEQVDPILLLDAIDKIKLHIITNLASEFASRFSSLSTENYCNDGKSIGDRALKNILLSYLVLVPNYQAMLNEQFETSTNMTDTLAVLKSLASQGSSDFDLLMAKFEQQWYDTPLVMDKWFVLQASNNTETIFERLDTLVKHRLFTLNNPNRARSLIGAFAQMNPRAFHCRSGRGYQFLSKYISKLNEINPQVASRLITPLIQYDNFDLERQQLMKNELIELSKIANLSKDLSEKLDAALR